MAGLGRMHKVGGRAGRGQRGGDLASHIAQFTHAADDHPSFGLPQQCHRPHQQIGVYLSARAVTAAASLTITSRKCRSTASGVN